MSDCNHCNEHSGLTTQVDHIAKRQDAMHTLLASINTRVIFTLGGVVVTGFFFLLNFMLKYWPPAKAAAEVINP